MSGWVTITSKRPFFHAIPRHFSTFWWTPGVFPSGLRGLGPKGGLGVLGYPHPYTDSLPGHPSTQLLDQYHNALHLCHTRHQRGSGCGKAWLDTRAELAYDSVEGSTYVIGTRTATVSRTLART